MAVHSGPDLTPLQLAAWEGLLRAHASLVRDLDAELEAHHGLSLSSCSVLQALRCAPEGKLRMADLAAQAQLSRSGMTRLVDRLERNDLLKRCSCSDDARGCFAVLTEAGAAQADRAAETHVRSVRARFSDRLEERDLHCLIAAFEKLQT